MQTTDDLRTSTRARSQGRVTALLASVPVPVAIVVLLVTAVMSSHAALLVAVPVVGACVAWAVFARRTSMSVEHRVLGVFDAREATLDSHARLHNVTEGLCLTLGVPKPRLMSLDSDALIAGAVAGPQSVGSLFVSSAFTDSMDRMEHEAVVAHLLVRLRSGDILARTTRIGWMDATVSIGLGGVIGRILDRSSQVQSPFEADVAACQVTRYPPGLASALSKIARGVRAPESLRKTVDLWVADPGMGDTAGDSSVPSVEAPRLSTEERIDLLKEI